MEDLLNNHSYDIFIQLPFFVGAYIIFSFLLQTMRTLFYCMLPSPDLLTRYNKKSWAVVTGASDGIGAGFCQQLAKSGFNVCLISRTKQKLEKVQKMLKAINSNIQTKIIICDFNQATNLDFFRKIEDQLDGLDIGLLVNNVGVLIRSDFESTSSKQYIKHITVNCIPMVMISKYVITHMLKRNYRSGIINISSVMGTWSYPRLSVYCATKAFNDLFSRSLSNQYKQKIDIISIRPLFVKSNLVKQNGKFILNPNQCARGSLNKLSIDDQSCGHWFHSLQYSIIKLLPQKLLHRGLKIGRRRVPTLSLIR